MKNVKFSFVVPYKQRLDNIALLFESLAHQTMPKGEFEVVVGAMEYCPAYASLCNRFKDRLNIVTVCSSKDWQVALARNIAIKQASGKIVVFLDADMILSPKFLENLYNRHYSYNQNQCIIGQMINYDNNTSDVNEISVKPYNHYEELLLSFEQSPQKMDDRFKVSHNIPWSFAWTALIALPRDLLLQNQLFFDENFFGYGVEDLEWGYRICQAGIPITLKEDVFGIHLPHLRNVSNNRETERVNYQYFLKKFPALDVELTCVFGDFQGNCNFNDLTAEIAKIAGHSNDRFCLVKGMVNNKSILIVGLLGKEGELVPHLPQSLKLDRIEEELPILGMSLPYDSRALDECWISASLKGLSPKYRDLILGECHRVGIKTIDIG